jgi:uncharacterized protein (DUF427 family)
VTNTLDPDASILRHREQWRYRGADRPAFAQSPKAGEESVWDYPRPPRIVPDTRLVQVYFGDRCIAESSAAVRVLETSSPPTFYVAPTDVRLDWLAASGSRSSCEWKGIATALDLLDGPPSAGWTYPETFPEFQTIAGWIAFYPSKLTCVVDGERVRPQPGGYYGGWVTDEIIGPVKGEPGCEGL